ncbi:MAG: insulinase family protein [Myxococcales bacterium]|nr:insulinase family protein [Myxococcales bacterium]
MRVGQAMAWTVCLVCLAMLVACADTKPRVVVQSSMEIRHYRLPNGLEVILHPDPSFRNVVVNVRYDTGSREDPRGQEGLAHLVEHLTFRRVLGPPKSPSTSPVDDAGLDAAAEEQASRATPRAETLGTLENEISSNYNAFTSLDATEYHMVVAPDDLPMALWLEAQRMRAPLAGLTEEQFDTERSVVRNETRQRDENAPYGNVGATLVRAAFPDGHPYHTAFVSAERELEGATLASATAFTREHYRAANATLVVGGRFDVGEAARLVLGTLGALPSTPPRPIVEHALRPIEGGVELVMEAGVDSAMYAKAWLVPPAGHAGHLEAHLLARLLEGHVFVAGREGELARVRAGVWSGRLGALLIISVELRAGLQPSVGRARVIEGINTLLDADEPPSTWGAIKSGVIAEHAFDMEHLDERATRFQDDVTIFGEPDVFQPLLHAFTRVRYVDVLASAHALLRRRHGVGLYVYPVAGAPRGGRAR